MIGYILFTCIEVLQFWFLHHVFGKPDDIILVEIIYVWRLVPRSRMHFASEIAYSTSKKKPPGRPLNYDFIRRCPRTSKQLYRQISFLFSSMIFKIANLLSNISFWLYVYDVEASKITIGIYCDANCYHCVTLVNNTELNIVQSK